MRVLVTGANGQLGRALGSTAPLQIGPEQLELFLLDRTDFDLTDLNNCKHLIEEIRPQWIINTAAYTSVDQAEDEPELADLVNAQAPQLMASVLSDTGGNMLQISTDFVFNGQSSRPYDVNERVDPLSVYGRTKAAGEISVLERLGDQKRCCILRTSWLYSDYGKNFMNTMLRLHAERSEISVVADQIGCPTNTKTLAEVCWLLIKQNTGNNEVLPEILHWSDAGVASWYDFAVSIGDIAHELAIIDKKADVLPIRSIDYPAKATRPSYSLLDTFNTRDILGLKAMHWRTGLLDTLVRTKLSMDSI